MQAIAILACGLGLGLLVYRYDLYEREPWYMLLLACVLGMAAAWGVGYGEDWMLELLPDAGVSLGSQAAVAGVLEELVKLLAVLAIWCFFTSHFNDPFDGLIYGAIAGLGFAFYESYFYTQLAGAAVAWYAWLGQEIVRLFLHMLLGGLTCVGLGLARFRTPGWRSILSATIVASMLIHVCWDFFCGLPADDEVDFLAQRMIAVAMMVTAAILFGMLVVVAQRKSGHVLAVRRLEVIWGWPLTLLMRRKE